MYNEENYQDIETGVMILGLVYAASIIGLIFWLII